MVSGRISGTAIQVRTPRRQRPSEQKSGSSTITPTQRLPSPSLSALTPAGVSQLQCSAGNHAVARLIAGARSRAAIQRWHVGDTIGARFTGVPEGPIRPTLNKGKYWGTEFEIQATFDPDRIDGADEQHFTTGEYRQYVKGYYKDCGNPVEHTLYNGERLDPRTWHEDGNGKVAPYGHRNRNDGWGKYTDEGAAGSSYKASDKPGIAVKQNERVDMFLDFRGELVRTDQASNVLPGAPVIDRREWSVKGAVKKTGRAKNPIITEIGL